MEGRLTLGFESEDAGQTVIGKLLTLRITCLVKTVFEFSVE